jgi:hypothetical protein
MLIETCNMHVPDPSEIRTVVAMQPAATVFSGKQHNGHLTFAVLQAVRVRFVPC